MLAKKNAWNVLDKSLHCLRSFVCSMLRSVFLQNVSLFGKNCMAEGMVITLL